MKETMPEYLPGDLTVYDEIVPSIVLSASYYDDKSNLHRSDIYYDGTVCADANMHGEIIVHRYADE